MSELAERARTGDLGFVDESSLARFVAGQRWFGAKSAEIVQASVLDAPVVAQGRPLFVGAIVEVRFQPGTHEIYNLPLGLHDADEGWGEAIVDRPDSLVVYDATADPAFVRELVRLTAANATLAGAEEQLVFRSRSSDLPPGARVRPIGGEQSNSSFVVDERTVLKLYRHLEPGPNPELELLAFLTDRGYANVPALEGWIAYEGRVMDATFAVLQAFVAGEGDGWELTLRELDRDPEALLTRLGRLGTVTGELHATLAADSADPAFGPEEPSAEALALLVAQVDEEIAATFAALPDEPAYEPIRGRGEEVRDVLRGLSQTGSLGQTIRHHGDFHLGQAIWTGDDWVLVDFEGEPGRSLAERRRKRSPLRDVAGMLRSFAYAAEVSSLHGRPPPEDWLERARQVFLDAYLATAGRSAILPADTRALERLLAIFELEKAVYELRYERDHRPEWASIPVAGIVRPLEEAVVDG